MPSPSCMSRNLRALPNPDRWRTLSRHWIDCGAMPPGSNSPVNLLGLPLFGQSIALAGGVDSAQAGNPVADRLVNVGIALSF